MYHTKKFAIRLTCKYNRKQLDINDIIFITIWDNWKQRMSVDIEVFIGKYQIERHTSDDGYRKYFHLTQPIIKTICEVSSDYQNTSIRYCKTEIAARSLENVIKAVFGHSLFNL